MVSTASENEGESKIDVMNKGIGFWESRSVYPDLSKYLNGYDKSKVLVKCCSAAIPTAILLAICSPAQAQIASKSPGPLGPEQSPPDWGAPRNSSTDNVSSGKGSVAAKEKSAKGPTLTGDVTASALPGGGGIPGGDGISAPGPVPPEKFAISPGGVDMRTGSYRYSKTDLSIGGGGDAGLDFTRVFDTGPGNDGYVFKQNLGKFFTHNWIIRLVENRIQVIGNISPSEFDFIMSVQFDKLSTTFRSVDSPINYKQVSNDSRATLTMTGNPNTASTYTFTASDGTVVLFRPFKVLSGGTDCTDGSTYRCVYASRVTKPDGTVYDLEYDTTNAIGWDTTRLRSVTSNRGFALLLEYNMPSAGYNTISKACLLNVAFTPKPISNICPAGVVTANYAYSDNVLTSAIDGSGSDYAFSHTAGNPGSFSLFNPGSPVPWATMTYRFDYLKPGNVIINSQQFADGSEYFYNFHTFTTSSGGDEGPQTEVAGGSFTDSDFKTVTLRYGGYTMANSSDPTLYITPGPETITDQLGRITVGNYCFEPPVGGQCGITPLRSLTAPEGTSQFFTYDNSRNVTQVLARSKPGSGLADIVTRTTYTCAPATACNKPLTTTDANGNTTNYAYDSVHGGILKRTLPADASGLRAETRYAYAQKYAWLRSGSGFVQAATPVWMLASEEYCKTSAADANGNCAGGAIDEVVTTYEYQTGSSATGSNLLLRGTAVTANGTTLRTCYGYDTYGRRISETQPKAGLTSCP